MFLFLKKKETLYHNDSIPSKILETQTHNSGLFPLGKLHIFP